MLPLISGAASRIVTYHNIAFPDGNCKGLEQENRARRAVLYNQSQPLWL